MKDYKLEIEQREEYVYAYYEAEKDSVALSNKLWGKISTAMSSSDLSKLLVVENIKINPGSVLEIYNIVNAAVKLDFRGMTIAFVDLIEDHYSSNKFGETLAVNLGVNGKIFRTIEEAEEWLKTQP
ncbi:MAG TPA: hypothetical protein DF712_18250 [Balneola sp.]|jgi:hypothetical protein|nr:hypothetical protein [Bacteroidota bacterium]MAC06353.1 hypothetical protein [Balneola sp.]MAO76497.1 hypothetical protein [Balneola sp.]MBF65978.1 hypothetical protein [Balneola sp.]HAH52185.1 hypothetical protein [Balneola sp.]|tara:strand:+ start:11682 stop:12059 length:378 start_codon:yes stop_codon:yes gene_type:complete